MSTFLIILAFLIFATALYCCISRPLPAPGLAFIAMLCLSFNGSNGYAVLPLNSTILISWLCMSVVVMLMTTLQPTAIMQQKRGAAYMTIGAICGMAIGLLGFSISTSLTLLYGIMIAGVIAGLFFGFLLYSLTPQGKPVGLRSGVFFKYLLAKGFPIAITVMQLGVVLTICVAQYIMTQP